MNYETLLSELTKLHNNAFFENKKINGLIIKIYKRLRKELRKYIGSSLRETQFHRDTANYAAGLIGYYSQSNGLDDNSKRRFQNAYKVLKVYQKPYKTLETNSSVNEAELFTHLTKFKQHLNLENSYCHKVFKLLQKICFMKKNKTQNNLGLCQVELLTMSVHFGYKPKTSKWSASWIEDLYSPYCQKYNQIKTPINDVSVKLSVKQNNTIQNIEEKNKGHFWSIFRKQ